MRGGGGGLDDAQTANSVDILVLNVGGVTKVCSTKINIFARKTAITTSDSFPLPLKILPVPFS